MGFDIEKLQNNIFNSVEHKYLDEFKKEVIFKDSFNIKHSNDRISENEFSLNYEKLNVENYSPDDKIVQFCYLFGVYDRIEKHYLEFKSIFSQIKKDNYEKLNLIEMFYLVADFYCSKRINQFEKIDESIRKRNCELVNLEQQKNLESKDFDFKIIEPKRRLVLYFRDLQNGGVFQDSFDFLLICYFLDKYVNLGNSKLFTQIDITSRNLNMYPRITRVLFPNLKYKYESNHEIRHSFNKVCGLGANTIHFNIGMPNEMMLGSIPLLSNMNIYDRSKRNMMEFKGENLIDGVTYVKLNINYNYNDRNKHETKGKLNKILSSVFGTKNYGSKFDIIDEIHRGVLKLEEVVIEQARIKLTNGKYD